MSYQVFARKYRPQTFAEVVGQEPITRTLANAVREGRVAQAYMFVGPRGIGKTSTARILAKALNCEKGPTPEPCGRCGACLEIAEGRCLDVIEIDGASNNGVDNIRDLREAAAYAPARCRFKIYLIDEVHMLSTGAFNALLKTLEEPPPHVKFIFATTEAQKVPPTITSRCQRFDLRRIPAADIAAHLTKIAGLEGVALEPAAAEAIARAAEGGLRDAESMLDQAVAFCGKTVTREGVLEIFGLTPREAVSGLVEAVLARDVARALEVVAAQAEAGKDLNRLAAEVTAYLRDLLVRGAVSDSPRRRHDLLLLLDHFAETESRMRWAADKKLVLDVAAIKAAHLLGQATLDEVLETLIAAGARPEAAPQPQNTASLPAASSPSPPALAPTPPASPSAAARAENASEALDASRAWEEIAPSFERTLTKQWAAQGVFAGFQQGKLTIRLPASAVRHARTVVGEQAREEIAAAMSERLGRKVEVFFEADDSLAEPAQPEPPPESPVPPEPASPAGENTAASPEEEFLNDPAIQLAVEKFAAKVRIKRAGGAVRG